MATVNNIMQSIQETLRHYAGYLTSDVMATEPVQTVPQQTSPQAGTQITQISPQPGTHMTPVSPQAGTQLTQISPQAGTPMVVNLPASPVSSDGASQCNIIATSLSSAPTSSIQSYVPPVCVSQQVSSNQSNQAHTQSSISGNQLRLIKY